MRPQNAPFDLEDRLVGFACMCLQVADLLPNTKAGMNLEYQLVKSGTAAALNYGEAQAAESPADFLHKIKVVLKEIRESRVNLKIIMKMAWIADEKLRTTFEESGELMAIFLKSVDTTKKKQVENKK